jgi:hypothetical protein
MLKRTILFSLIISLACLTVNAQCRKINYVYWEQVNDSVKKETIASKEVYGSAINYYKGIIKFTDDEESFRLLKILTSEVENSSIKALYFYLFNRICIQADGAAAERLGDYCQKIMINGPIYVLNYFLSQNSIMKRYAQLIGSELYYKEKGVSDIEYNFSDFKKLINDKISSDVNLQKAFKDFSSEIEKIMTSMD